MGCSQPGYFEIRKRNETVLNLVVFPVDRMKSIVASESEIVHCIVARSWSLSVAPEDKDWLPNTWNIALVTSHHGIRMSWL